VTDPEIIIHASKSQGFFVPKCGVSTEIIRTPYLATEELEFTLGPPLHIKPNLIVLQKKENYGIVFEIAINQF
jgi:hypothetical protein